MITVVPYVAAEFFDKSGSSLFKLTPAMRGTFVDIKEPIQQDPLFRMLVDDGSIKIITDETNRKALENNPMAGISPEGRRIDAEVSAAEPAGEERGDLEQGDGSVVPHSWNEQNRPRSSSPRRSSKTDSKPKTEAKPQTESKTAGDDPKVETKADAK